MLFAAARRRFGRVARHSGCGHALPRRTLGVMRRRVFACYASLRGKERSVSLALVHAQAICAKRFDSIPVRKRAVDAL